jgi:uncharacterized coiled-coil protein SlyX
MADKDDEFEAELKKLESPGFDDDDDASSAMGGFPGEIGGFADDEAPADEPDPFAGGFEDFEDAFETPQETVAAESDDTYSGDEEDLGEPDDPDFGEDPQFDEEDDAFDPEAEHDDPEHDETAELDDEDEADAGDEDDESAAPSGKGNLILYGGLAAVLTLVGGAGYMVFQPMLAGGSAPQAVSPLETQAPAQFQPGAMEPAAIPQPGQPQAAPAMPTALPSPVGGDRVQVPGYPANVDQSTLRPTVSGTPVQLPGAASSVTPSAVPTMPAMGRPALPAPVATQPQPSPVLQPAGAPDVLMPAEQVPAMPSLGTTTSEPPVSTEAPDVLPALDLAGLDAPEVTLPEDGPAAPLPTAAVETDAPLSKMGAIMDRLSDLEAKLFTEDDVSKMIDAAVAKVAISSGGEGFNAVEGMIESLNERVTGLEEKLLASTPTEERIAQLEARFEEKIAGMEAMIASYEEMVGQMQVKVEDAAKAKEASAAKLKATVTRQQAEIVSLKARGGAYTPPSKPKVYTDYRLAGLSSDQAWIETPGGVSRFTVGQEIPGLGDIIKEFRQMDGNFVVVTSNGIIVP